MAQGLHYHIRDLYVTLNDLKSSKKETPSFLESYELTKHQVGALISFIVIGIDVFFVMQSLGELSTLYPTSGAFTELAGRFIDPAFSFALGWNYWYMVSQHQCLRQRQFTIN